MQRIWMFLLTAMVGLSTLLGATPASAQSGERCFRETGFCISGPIRTYWERNGGLSVFGYPISALQTETNNDGWTGPTQWFERDRLEDHANQGLGVLAGRLGVSYLQLQGTSWESYPRIGPNEVGTGCRYFAVTGHSLCGEFLRYWERNGGLERFGYPVTQPHNENLPEWSGTVQYFERRRMELHPELAGTQYEVLLGLLGKALKDPWACQAPIADLRKTAEAYADTFSCAAPFPQVAVNIATQPFERGQMVWIAGRNGAPGTIVVVYYDNARNSLVWQMYGDTWSEGQPVSGGETPPTGLFEPVRGFGKVWRENQGLRNTLGWAAAPEIGDVGHNQYFMGGAWMIYRSAQDRVFLLRPDGRADDIARIK
jgi:hypothetical protein